MLVFVFFICGLIAAYAAGIKQRTAWWSLMGFFLGPVGLIIVLLLPAVSAPQELIEPGAIRACPFCAEDVKTAAIVCKHCGRDLPAVAVTREAIPSDTPLVGHGQLHSKVAGVSATNNDGTSRQDIIAAHCASGKELFPRREPDNQYDRHAIGLWVVANSLFSTRELQVGYIGAHLAAEMAAHIDQGGRLDCLITEVTGGGEGHPIRGINILLSKV